jgi:GNAT superfamily N-acetyltransferase
MNSDLSMRTASLGDVDAIATLINAAFRVEQFFIDGDRITSQEVCRRFLTGTFLLAESGDGIVGCVYSEIRRERTYIGLLSVHPSRQRTGVGSRLMDAAEGLGRQHQCAFIDLQIVNLRKDLPGFYRRLGYIETGSLPFPSEVHTKLPCHFVIMSKAL